MTPTKPRRPISPGEVLKRDYIDPKGLTVTQVASHLGIVVAQVSKLIKNEVRLSAEYAVRIATVTHTQPEYWLQLQVAVDLYRVRIDTYTMSRMGFLKPFPGVEVSSDTCE